MNARTFVSNAEGDVELIEITELETSSGRIVRIMFEDKRMDDIRLSLDGEGKVKVKFFKEDGEPVNMVVGHHSIVWEVINDDQ